MKTSAIIFLSLILSGYAIRFSSCGGVTHDITGRGAGAIAACIKEMIPYCDRFFDKENFMQAVGMACHHHHVGIPRIKNCMVNCLMSGGHFLTIPHTCAHKCTF